MNHGEEPRRWRALAVCLAAGFITMLDVSIVNVAMPSIERSLHAGPTELQLIVAGYSLAFGLALIPAGRLGDIRGRRTIFLVGLAGFLLSSVVAGMAPNDTVLALARLAQGFSAGLVSPQVIGLIQQLFPGPERAKALGLFGATIGTSTALGPLLGGLLIEVGGQDNGWRLVFLVNVPIVLAVMVAALRLLPRGAPKAGARLDVDQVGLILIGIATLTIMLPFVTTTGRDDNPLRWLWLAVAALALVLLVLWARRYERAGRHPVLDLQLLRTPSFRWGALLGLAYFAGFTSIFLVVTLYLQQGLGFTALQAGLISMPNAICSAISSGLSSRFAHRGRIVVVVGLVIVIAGLIGTDLVARLVPGQSGGWAIAATLAVCGIGGGVVIAPNQTMALADVPVTRAGTAAGLLQTGQRLGSAVGVALVLSAFYTSLGPAVGSRPGSAVAEGAYASALSTGMLITITLVVVALAVGIIDARRRRSGGAESQPSR